MPSSWPISTRKVFDLHLETIRLLAWRFRHLDLLVNLPVQAIDRSISANAIAPVKRVLEHPDPKALLAGGRTGANILDGLSTSFRRWDTRKVLALARRLGLRAASRSTTFS